MKQRGGRARPTPSSGPGAVQAHLVDLAEEPIGAPLERVGGRVGSRERVLEAPDRDEGEARLVDADFERVGGRRFVRGEILALGFGLVFLAAAAIKPWGPAAPAPAGPRPSTGIAAAVSASPSEPAQASAYVEQPEAAAAIDWSRVDWSALGQPDPHSTWGIAVAAAPTPYSWPDPFSLQPVLAWTQVDGDASAGELTSTLLVAPVNEVFAIAVTWPAGFEATGIRFAYSPGQALAAAPSLSNPTALPTVPAAGIALPRAGPGAHAPGVRSGEYLIVNPDHARPSLRDSAAAWKKNPWYWPTGQYLITVASAGATETLAVGIVGARY